VKETATVFGTRYARPDGYAEVITGRGACIHYYFYWIHPELGLIHVRVPTWLPLRLHWQFPELSRSQITRLLKRLRLHGLLRKIGHTYTYYITRLGRQVLMSVLHLKEHFFVTELSGNGATV
jgi:hypothetical protein